MCVIVKPRKMRRPRPPRGCRAIGKKIPHSTKFNRDPFSSWRTDKQDLLIYLSFHVPCFNSSYPNSDLQFVNRTNYTYISVRLLLARSQSRRTLWLLDTRWRPVDTPYSSLGPAMCIYRTSRCVSLIACRLERCSVARTVVQFPIFRVAWTECSSAVVWPLVEQSENKWG